jgi:hypothetical protein
VQRKDLTLTISLPDGPVLTPGAAEDAYLGDIVARRAQVADKLFTAKHQLGGAGPVTAADHLEGLALGAAMARAATQFRALDVFAAVRAGATWDQAAAATGLPLGELLSEVRAWADGQRRLYEDTPAGHTPLGLSAEEHADVVALLDTAATQPAREAK